MPLRDHFPASDGYFKDWPSLLGGLPAMLTLAIKRTLPHDFVVRPVVKSGLTANPPVPGQYGVRIFDREMRQRLIAAIEIVSPSNKDRLEHRHEFVERCVSWLRQSVLVSVVDFVTKERANLYLDLLDFFGESDVPFEVRAANLHAVTLAARNEEGRPTLKAWAYPLVLGASLPSLPIFLSDKACVPLELEAVYEETCKVLGMT